jgi:hypothetical protein
MHIEDVSSKPGKSLTMIGPGNVPSGSGARIIGSSFAAVPAPELMVAPTLVGDTVMSSAGEHVGRITAIMIEVRSRRIYLSAAAVE